MKLKYFPPSLLAAHVMSCDVTHHAGWFRCISTEMPRCFKFHPSHSVNTKINSATVTIESLNEECHFYVTQT